MILINVFFVRKFFTEREAAMIVRDVASALQFLHAKGKQQQHFSYFKLNPWLWFSQYF